MSECIELEHSDEYQRGYADGIESFRATFESITEPKTCDGCGYAVYDEETDEYSYYHNSEICRTCIRSGWNDNYKPKDME